MEHQLPDAGLASRLTGALIGLARATSSNDYLITPATDAVVVEGLSATEPGQAVPREALTALIARVEAEKYRLVPNCATCAAPCGRTSDYDLGQLQNEPQDIRSLKIQILCAARALASQVCAGAALGLPHDELYPLFYQALFALGEDWDEALLLPLLRQLHQANPAWAGTE